ncbi:histone-lysine N-methyltransferase, H3 lysine-9 specific SUVH5-like [Sesamum indicum]|uniref:Histone-lysine N-methyltransferase, H3 lysine-9 specific SUVH5-like n=1 Tax=Sesamum indicum TaxID=4182 RepID=A0A6I9T0Y1_SESIN|nr:histone-lysine N-methyltransferase, H3 lysine-9 specific SUVH5-like [Sesamum indicum]
MSLLADSSPPPRMPGKRFFGNVGFNSHNFPSSFKRPKLDAVRGLPVSCGASASVAGESDTMQLEPNSRRNSTVDSHAIPCGNSPFNIKRPKVDGVRDFPERCGPFLHRTNGGESDRSHDEESSLCSDVAKYGPPIPAVPLRSVPTSSVQCDPEDSLASPCKAGDAGKMADGRENKVDSREEMWKRDLEELVALIAEAKDYINLINVKYSATKEVSEEFLASSKGFNQISLFESGTYEYTSSEEPEQSMATVRREETGREKNLTQSVPPEALDAEKMLKVEDMISKMAQGENAYESMSSDNEDEVCILSPAEWSMSQSCFRRKYRDVQASIGKLKGKDKICGSDKFTGDCSNMVEYQGVGNADLVDSFALGEKTDKQSEAVFEFEHIYDDEHRGTGIWRELINLNIGRHDQPEGLKVREALKLFEEQYTELLEGRKADPKGEGKGTKHVHLEVAERLKAEGVWNVAEKSFGHIPGIEIGDQFRFRAELAVSGLHFQLISGIDYVTLGGKKFATSIVNSGRYENEAKALDVLIYSGQGGNPKITDKAGDQKLEKGNLALMNSKEIGYPIRVIYKRKCQMASNMLGMINEGNYVYVYDGLYTVNNLWQERDQNGNLVFKFELHRMPGQPRPHQKKASRKSKMPMEVCLVNDISQGKEKVPIHAINGVDEERPLSFTYITDIVYPSWYQPIEPIGCNCIDGCSDSNPCSCVLKNEGEIPFNEKGCIIRARPIIHECGPSCKCPPSCMNRVSQHGPRYQLEIFKTVSRGWGVRSRNYISSGSFICEYVGELLRDKEAEQRIGNDEYLFDVSDGRDEGESEVLLDFRTSDDGFAIDAARLGNVGRFINHSCSPNLYAQEVLYDHQDKRLPHIMFFANKNIPPLQELTYDYNYKVGRVCDGNGNIKTKDCYCGSRKCTGRMY